GMNPALEGRIGLPAPSDAMNDARFSLVSSSLDMVTQRPFLGHGSGAAMINTDVSTFGTHNQLLSYQIQYGLLGTFVFIGALVAIFSGASRRHWGLVLIFLV